MAIPPNEPEITIYTFETSIADADLVDHLQEHALHYSSAIWRALDASTVTTLLASYELEGRRLIEIIDPVPVTATGNYLVFRLYGGEESEEWCTFLETHGVASLPLPPAA